MHTKIGQWRPSHKNWDEWEGAGLKLPSPGFCRKIFRRGHAGDRNTDYEKRTWDYLWACLCFNYDERDCMELCTNSIYGWDSSWPRTWDFVGPGVGFRESCPFTLYHIWRKHIWECIQVKLTIRGWYATCWLFIGLHMCLYCAPDLERVIVCMWCMEEALWALTKTKGFSPHKCYVSSGVKLMVQISLFFHT